MANFNINILSSKNKLSITLENDGFADQRLDLGQPQDALVRLAEVLSSFATMNVSAGEETEEVDVLEPGEQAETQICRECGCTEEAACEGGCWWVEDDLCSECEASLQKQAAEEAESERPTKHPKPKKDKVDKPVKTTKEKPNNADWDGYYSIKEISAKIGKSEPNIHLMASQGLFPKADKKIGVKNAWKQDVVTDWMYAQSDTKKETPEEETEEEEIEEDEGEIENLEEEDPEEIEQPESGRAKDLMGDF